MKPIFLAVLLFCAPVWAQNPLTVRVVDAAKAPLAGATVEVRLWGEDDEEKIIAPATTDQNGTATFSLPSKPTPKLARGAVTVAAKGFAFASGYITGESVEVPLEKGVTWRGQVVDEAGKPIEGAKIRVTGATRDGDFRRGIWLSDTKISDLYTVQSGADGNFEIADVPAKVGLSYGVTHPRYAAARGQDVPVEGKEIIKLAPGGGLRGRVLDVEGRPLAKISVDASRVPYGEGGNDTVTDENGVYSIESLAAGDYRVIVRLPRDAKFVVAQGEKVRVEIGKVAVAPVMRAVTGVEIRGVVRDAATKKPLAGASVMATQNNDTRAYTTSDAKGAFVLRVARGKYQVHMSGGPQGYLRSGVQPTLEIGDTAPEPLVFDLKKAVKITGLTVDEAGKPLKARLTVGWGSEIESDATGKWQYTPHDNDALSFGGGEDESGYFEVVGRDKFETPIRGPVAVKVRKRAWNTVSGRVVSPDGTPIEGVKVAVNFHVSLGDGSGLGATRTAFSDAQGRFAVTRVRAGRDVKISGQKAGFTFQNGGKISQSGAQWTADDLIFAALNRKIEGVTAPGARIVAAGREIVAGADGKFVFEGLPAREVPVYAARDGQLGIAVAATDAPLQITLKKAELQGRDAELAAQIQAEALRDAKGNGKTYVENWLHGAEGKAGFEAALQIALQDSTPRRDSKIAEAISTWKAGDSLESLRQGLEAIKDGEMRVFSYLSAALAAKDADLAQRALESAETSFKTAEKHLYTRESNLYLSAVLAERIEGEKAGFAALDRAIAFTLKNHGEKTVVNGAMETQTGRDEVMARQADTVAQGSPALLRRLLEAIEPQTGNDIRALADAIPVVAKTHGVEAALPLLEELKAKPMPQLEQGARRYLIFEPDFAFGSAARALIPLLGAQSPARALEMARRVSSEHHRAQALASAARFQNGEEAANLWREAVKEANTEDAPRFAAIAWESDAKLGAELFEIAHQKAEAEMSGEMNYRNAWVPFAFYSARADAARARLILEREWEKALGGKMETYLLADFPAAMAPLDARRAWEMTRRVPDEDGNRWAVEARRKIARYLVASEEQRRAFVLNRLGSAFTVEEGEEKW